MQIVGSQLHLSAERSFARTELRQERLSVRTTASAPEATRIRLSPAARLAASQPAPGPAPASTPGAVAPTEPTDARSDPNFAFLIELIEAITGQPVRLYSSADTSTGADGDTRSSPATTSSPDSVATRAPGAVIDLERRHVVSETEVTRFDAEGVVRTADGREIAFRLSLDMSRHYREQSVERLRIGTEPQRKDPLVLNFSGTAAQLQDQRFDFDLDADDTTESIAQLAVGSGYLVLDRNGNGRVDDGRELFGALSGDGFADLAALDQDRNGWLDAHDPAFAQLRLWRPDGRGHGALQSLAERDVAAIGTANVASQFALRGNGNSDLGAIRSTGLYLTESGAVGTAQQIDLSV